MGALVRVLWCWSTLAMVAAWGETYDETNFLQLHNLNETKEVQAQVPKCITGKNALIVVDMQNDFILTNGGLPVTDGANIIPIINQLTQLKFDFVGFTEDFHEKDHISFAKYSPYGKNPFDFVTLNYTNQLQVCGEEYRQVYGPMVAGNCATQDIFVSFQQQLWPEHCIQNTYGQKLHDDIVVPDHAFIVRKGINTIVDSYGAFFNNIGMNLPDNTDWVDARAASESGLIDSLKALQIDNVFVVGLAEDYCVKYTALQALELDFQAYLITDATKPVSEQQGASARAELQQNGGILIKSCAVMGTCSCPSI
mgnify:FL=1|eukprot:symbB.v1.2.036034.t1/scaffold4993.1/size32019/1